MTLTTQNYLSFYEIQLTPVPHVEFLGPLLAIAKFKLSDGRVYEIKCAEPEHDLNVKYVWISGEPRFEPIYSSFPSYCIDNHTTPEYKQILAWAQSCALNYTIIWGIKLLQAYYLFHAYPKQEKRNFLLALANNPHSIESINNIKTLFLYNTKYTEEQKIQTIQHEHTLTQLEELIDLIPL